MMSRLNCNQSGFTYLGLVILIAIIGLVAASSLQVGAIVNRRDAEQELLEIGSEYIDALRSYADSTPKDQSSVPARLQDLLSDPRFPGIKRHLRRLYIDPLTGNNEWGTLYGQTSNGIGIVGIYSLSGATPIKKDNFDAPFESFKNKKTYREWVFTALAQNDPDGEPPPPSHPAPPVNAPKPPRPPVVPAAPAAPANH